MEQHYDFTVTGRLDGREVSVRWNDGEIAGDEIAVEQLRDLARVFTIW